MRLDQVHALFDASPAVRLLRSDNAPYVIDFLNGAFKLSGSPSVTHDDLRQALIIYQEHLHESDAGALPGPCERYLIQWSDSGWLNRYLQSSSSQPQYQLTRYAEDVIQFVDQLISRTTGLVGTESRLRLIIDTLSDLVNGASADPDKRLAYLEAQKQAIQREIDELQLGRPVDVYNPAQVREKFQLAVGLLKALQSDFRAVEERFHDIALSVQHQQQAQVERRGEILAKAMDAEDLLKSEDEGISFYAFIGFLFSPEGQQGLRETIDEVIRLEVVQDDRDSIARLKAMVRSLLREADKVLATNGRLSSSLRKLLNVESAEDRKQTAEVLLDIKQLAASLRTEKVGDKACQVSVQTTSGVESPFSRTFWTTPQSFQDQPEDHVIDLERTARQQTSLNSLEFLDMDKLRSQVQRILCGRKDVTLGDLLETFPPVSGIMELVGYFQIAFEDGHTINRDLYDEIVIADLTVNSATRVRTPHIVFRSEQEKESHTVSRPGKPR